MVVSDDNSSDGTLAILRRYAAEWKGARFHIVDGPQKGFEENYRCLVSRYGREHDFVAFCDQDDIWDDDKLAIAIAWLKNQGERPALFCGRTRYVDQDGAFLRLSPLFAKPPDMRNALVQSIAGGNTMVMNRAAALLVATACRDGPIVAHDWWSYLVVTACGGIVRYDPEPHVSYRQHYDNILGANDTNVARARQIVQLLQGRFAGWTNLNLAGTRRHRGAVDRTGARTCREHQKNAVSATENAVDFVCAVWPLSSDRPRDSRAVCCSIIEAFLNWNL